MQVTFLINHYSVQSLCRKQEGQLLLQTSTVSFMPHTQSIVDLMYLHTEKVGLRSGYHGVPVPKICIQKVSVLSHKVRNEK